MLSSISELFSNINLRVDEAEKVVALAMEEFVEWWKSRPAVPPSLADAVLDLGRRSSLSEALDELAMLTEKQLTKMGWGYNECAGQFPDPASWCPDHGPKGRVDAERVLANPEFRRLWVLRIWIESCPCRFGPHDLRYEYSDGVKTLTGDVPVAPAARGVLESVD